MPSKSAPVPQTLAGHHTRGSHAVGVRGGGWICMRLSSFSQSVLLITNCIHCQIMGQDKLNSPLR